MALDTPDRDIEIAIAPLPAPEGSPAEARAMAPIWAVDNLIVVAASLP